MDFSNKMGDKLQNVGKEVTKKTKDLGGVVSLNSQIKDSEAGLERIYKILGEKYYKSFREEASQRFTEETDEIIKIQSKLESDKEQLRALKGLKLCSNCGAEVDGNALHCPMCGTELPVINVAVQSESVQAEQPKPAFCPSCGAPLSAEAKFCGKCGTKIG